MHCFNWKCGQSRSLRAVKTDWHLVSSSSPLCDPQKVLLPSLNPYRVGWNTKSHGIVNSRVSGELGGILLHRHFSLEIPKKQEQQRTGQNFLGWKYDDAPFSFFGENDNWVIVASPPVWIIFWGVGAAHLITLPDTEKKWWVSLSFGIVPSTPRPLCCPFEHTFLGDLPPERCLKRDGWMGMSDYSAKDIFFKFDLAFEVLFFCTCVFFSYAPFHSLRFWKTILFFSLFEVRERNGGSNPPLFKIKGPPASFAVPREILARIPGTSVSLKNKAP